MNWIHSSKDLIAITIAALAVVVSLLTVILQRRQGQRAAYREMYTTLMSEDLHRGRFLIKDLPKTEDIPNNESDSRLIYRTLGVFDNLAMFARQRVVPRRWVLEVWHHPLKDMHEGANIIRQKAIETKDSGAISPWPQLWVLLDKAEAYSSMLPCCPPDKNWRNRVRRLTVTWRWQGPRQQPAKH